MRQKLLALLVSISFGGASGIAVAQENLPSGTQILKGAAGAAVGGVVGSQVGNGKGKTAATAVGAGAGAVVASGCKLTVASAVAGAVGGLLGAMVAGDKNRNLGAGAGAAVGAMAASDCSEQKSDDVRPVGTASGGMEPGNRPQPSAIGRVAAINSLHLSEVLPEDFPKGNFAGFPRITKKSDFAALDSLGQHYAKAAYEALARQDFELYATNRYLAQKVLEYRLHHKLAALQFASSVMSDREGRGVLMPGATVFLPAFSQITEDGKPTGLKTAQASDVLAAMLDANVGEIDWQALPKVADLSSGLGGVLNGIFSNTAGAVAKGASLPLNGAGGDLATAGNRLSSLPVGSVFLATDKNGQRFLVERTAEGFNIGNAGERPVSISLAEFGFMPVVDAGDDADMKWRKKAMPLVRQMQKVVLDEILRQRDASMAPYSPGGKPAVHYTGMITFWSVYFGTIGNYAVLNYPKHVTQEDRARGVGDELKSYYLNGRGEVMSGAELANFHVLFERLKKGTPPVRATPEYLLAVSMAAPLVSSRMVWSAEKGRLVEDTHHGYTTQIDDECAHISGGVSHSYGVWQGDGDVVEKRCYGPDNKLRVTRLYYYRNGMSLQTAESLLKDKEIAAGLAKADNVQKLGEAIVGVVPGIGNLDSGASCASGKTITERLFRSSNDGSGVFAMLGVSAEKYRPFVSDLLPPADDPSALEKAVDCAGAVPLIGNVLKKGKEISKATVVGYRSWLSSGAGAQVQQAISLFDSQVFRAGAVSFDFGLIAGMGKEAVEVLRNTAQVMNTAKARNDLFAAVNGFVGK